jgi:hypothetical protein
VSAAERRLHALDAFRLDNNTISAGCLNCPLLKQCGGYTRAGGGWSCMDRCASCDASCDLVCLKKPGDFVRALLEIGGFEHRGIPALERPAEALPRYIPVLQHGFDQEVPLEWAAFPLRGHMRFKGRRYAPIGASAAEVRARLGVSDTTKILLLATGKDRPIESYWRWRRLHGAPDALAALGLSCAVAPNYSMFLEEPRPQHMFNRKRSLICASEWSAAGIGVVPYLQAVAPADWLYWETFLREHAEVTHVAKEFQTGLANPERGREAIDNLDRLQRLLKRRLHVVAIGAARFRGLLDERFDDSWTLIDSEPFMKAVKRRVAARVDGRRVRWMAALGQDAGDLLFHNVGRYQEWLARGRAAPTNGRARTSIPPERSVAEPPPLDWGASTERGDGL